MTAVLGRSTAPAPDGAAKLPADRLLGIGYVAVLALSVLFTVPWLAIGAVIAVTANSPGLHVSLETSAATGSDWAQGVLAASARAEPLGQAVLDYAFSLLSLVLAVVLLARAHGDWVGRLLTLAMVGSAGAFNLQAHGATVVVEKATGVAIGQAHQIQLHGIACAAYIMALLLFPTGHWRLIPAHGRARSGTALVVLPAVATLLIVGIGTALLPHTISCILFFGFGVPLVGLAALQRRKSQSTSTSSRTQSRLMFSALVGAFATIVVLGLITAMLVFLRQPGLTLIDPTSKGSSAQPTAVLFWFSRLAAVAVAAAALVATRRGELWMAERVFSRGLASVLVVVLVGGGWVIARASIDRLYGLPTAWASIIATTASSVAFLPLYLRVEQLVERLLYGSRPTPYRVLAEVASLSGSRAGGPNLAAVAEAVGQALGARNCQLTVVRPGLRDRTYGWDADHGTREWTSSLADVALQADHLVLPISQGDEQIGAISVDRGALAGLQNERHHLLSDVADSLGAILQASRLGIELERQLRAALAHAEEIAVSRRAAVAEMDNERRGIERDLHDGAQHHLVTLRLALGLVEHEVNSGQLVSARERLGELGAQLRTAEAVLAKTATGVSSIVLSEQGLVAALRADLASAEPPVPVDGDDGLRFPPEVEAAVYFCCLESVNNARKHAGGVPISVAVEFDAAADALRFAVRDEGPGFTVSESGTIGRGLRNLASRVTTVGGRVDFDSAPGKGTTVRGRVPLAAPPVRSAAEVVAAAV
ncbi:MAG TPA: ATP-binding protein, partial [Pseudonocardia sp.]